MALSPSSRHRSRIIREMTQDLNKTNHSYASSTGSHHGTVSDDSTVSDIFDPENEAIMSTRQMDLNFSQQLPELRDTAKKYGRWNDGRQPDFVINTSAIGRAFPGFSEGGSSDDSLSMEVGRGAKTRQRTSSQQTRPQYSNNDIDSPIVTVGDFQILSTPPTKAPSKLSQQQDAPRSSTRKESSSKRTSAHKENIPPPNSLTSVKRISGYISGATRTSSGEQRRTLAELHAQVADDSDGSYIADERPATVTIAAKSSRFANNQPRKSPLASVSGQGKQKVTDALIDALAGRRTISQKQTPSKPPSNGTVTSNTLNPTNQSFLLPNMPDISEVVSGTFKNGTPVFTRSGKVQTRFSSNSTERKAHDGLDGIPIPQEEKDIFLSLQLLQEKVATLEMEKADTQNYLEELQNENYRLQAEREEFQKRRRSDSALGMADSGSDGEYARDNQKLVAEKTSKFQRGNEVTYGLELTMRVELEAQLKMVQNRLDTSDRKITNLELRLKNNTAERDQAVKQLAEAFYSCEQLQSENDSLRQENESLKQQLAQLVSENEENALNWQEKESSLRRKIHRREQAFSVVKEATREVEVSQQEVNVRNPAIHSSDSASSRHDKGKRASATQEVQQNNQPEVRVQMQQSIQQGKGSNGQNVERGRTPSVQQPAVSQIQPEDRMKSKSRSRSRALSTNDKLFPDGRSAFQIRLEEIMNFNDTTDDEAFDETTQTIHKDLNINGREDWTRGSNFSDILGHGELERICQVVATEKALHQERLAAAAAAQTAENDTVRSVRTIGSVHEEKQTLNRNSSTKGLVGILKNNGTRDQEDNTGRLSIKSGGQEGVEQDPTAQSITSHQRRHSEDSINSRIKTRQRIIAEELTSAFILPDITIHGASHGKEHPALSANARRVLDNLAQHDGHNCTVCSRVASFETENATINIDTKKTIRIEKPIPVSDRMPVAGPYDDEPTIRPATAPGLALAAVLKALQDEFAHLKMEHARYQASYNKHDVSLGMRKRKTTKAKIESLLKAMDNKADQVYALYDVLEGQKQSGQQMSEQDIEITLQNIGVDVDALKQNQTSGGDNNSEDGDSEEGSDLDLPWEGIEDTTGMESGKGRRQSWHM